MKVLGMVLELNPFHNGHKYFIDTAKEKINPNLTIAIISGNFSMRGEPMVIDKWERAKIALNYGIDIVIELPFLSSVNGADYFAYNAIKSLTGFKITDLAFGVELDNLTTLLKIKDILNSDIYNNTIKEFLSKGLSYPTSSFRAIGEITKDKEIIDNCTLPNNTLAISYLQALDKLNYEVNPVLIKRVGNEYYDEDVTGKISSATALRNLLMKGEDITNYTPEVNYQYLNPVISDNNLLLILRYLFNINDIDYFKDIFGVSEGIENRINSFINKVSTYEELIKHIQTKRYSKNRIKRLLLHIILNVSKEYENKYHSYLRILAMNQKGINYINTLDKEVKEKIVTSFKNEDNYLINLELKASKLYGVINEKPMIFLQEFKVPYIEGEEKNDD